MRMKKRILALILIVFSSFSLCWAQQQHQPDSVEATSRAYRRPLGETQINEVFRSHGITAEKLARLKQMGVDLHRYLARGEYPDYRIKAVFYKMVVLGKVLRIVNMAAPSSDPFHSNPFHSRVIIQILNLLKGPNQVGDTVRLARQSGLAINHGDTSWVSYTNEPNFWVGETAVFFLQNIYTSSYFRSAYKSFFSKAEPEFPNPTYWVQKVDKYDIVDSVVKGYGEEVPLGTLESEVKQIAEIVDRPVVK